MDLCVCVFLLLRLKMKLTQERDSLAVTAKKLGRDFAKVTFVHVFRLLFMLRMVLIHAQTPLVIFL